MASYPELRWHQEWIGFVQPVGLVVSATALLATQAHINRGAVVSQQKVLLDLVRQEKLPTGKDGKREEQPVIPDLPAFCIAFFGWQQRDIAGVDGGPDLPDSLCVALPEYGETLKPTYAVPDTDHPGSWILLIQTLPRGTDLDEARKEDDRHWHASPQARFERLLRETRVPIGLLFNGTQLRLVYAPAGESTGHITFPVKAMCEVAGRPIVAALHMLLGADRLFTVPTNQRLPAILRESRKYQNEVSTALAEQVLAALNELLRGFQAAHEASKGELLREVLATDPNHVYGGLLASLMRLVFILYAEDRGLLSNDPIYDKNYSVTGLFERLREDASRYPDTMDQRYGTWSQLLTLFRLIYDGGGHRKMHLPARHGKLFDPDAYSFLEGRPYGARRTDERVKPPRVADGVIYRVLTNLLLLDGERLSYRALDVEQIGSVYEAMMGFELRVATAPSIAVRPDNVVVNLQEVLQAKPDERTKILKESAACEVKGQALEQFKAAKTVDELTAALEKKVSRFTPNVLPAGAMFLQPTDERRRSGSHYTPRSLTKPIVETTMRPIFERLGERPRPEQILELKVCDPAMGSGAFLVEACLFLGDKLVASWQAHDAMPAIPPDEDPQLYARRLVAQQCLYGVDKNPFAVDLAKLSLWLATLAKDHPFTFIDHALRCGDSLVGLTRQQIAQFHWDTSGTHKRLLGQEQLERTIERVTAYRREILSMTEDNEASILLKQEKLAAADQALTPVRRAGDLLVAAFFNGSKEKEREALRKQYFDTYISASRGNVADLEKERKLAESLRQARHPVTPFHWELEFPEVFERQDPGFTAFVGNPPFLGGTRISTVLGQGYLAYLNTLFTDSGNRMDLIAYFFRRTFGLVRNQGTLGLVATNTIAQGDTRKSGLSWICNRGGTIYEARKRVKWPGRAAVVVSVVHIIRGNEKTTYRLNEQTVDRITAFLFHAGGSDDPMPLRENQGKSFIGSYLLGMGFVFGDGEASPIYEMEHLIRKDPRNQQRIFPFIGGEELNESPTLSHSRYVINFGQMSETEARAWPDLMAIIEAKVKPDRAKKAKEVAEWPWWQFWRVRPELYEAIAGLQRVLVVSRLGNALAFAFLPTNVVYSDRLVVIALDSFGAFAILQSRTHEIWARLFGSSLKDDLIYNNTDCFETFPFPSWWQAAKALEEAGRAYYGHRAAVMVRNNEGLTKTYNRFHDPEERDPDILRLRELHAVMDRAVLDAYGWTDIQPTCEFLLDYEEEETEEDGSPRRRKKPWRYRWLDEIRDEVLARLLELNRQRAEQEQLSGAAAEKSKAKRAGRKNKEKASSTEPITAHMFDGEKQ